MDTEKMEQIVKLALGIVLGIVAGFVVGMLTNLTAALIVGTFLAFIFCGLLTNRRHAPVYTSNDMSGRLPDPNRP